MAVKLTEEERKQEIWKEYPGTKRLFISNMGRVKRNGKLTKLGSDRDGYTRITINKKTLRLHRVVAELFVDNPNPEEYIVVDHINNVKDDNRSFNLRWCTPQMNTKFAGEMGLLSRNNNKKSVVIAIDVETGVGTMYSSNVELAKELGVEANRISHVITGKIKTLRGYKIIKVEELIDKRGCGKDDRQ